MNRQSTVTVLRLPYPYRAMVAISTDIDRTKIDTLRETHRFMNTLEMTSMGRGVGLDIANSFWLYNRQIDDSIAYFPDVSWDQRSPHAEELVHYIRHGWIDTLHSYGNFTKCVEENGFVREHAVQAFRILDAHGVKIRVWTNHGNRDNSQNMGSHAYMRGDRPDSDCYHIDLLLQHGVEYMWNAGHADSLGGPSVIKLNRLNDGSPVFGFHRSAWQRNMPEIRQTAMTYHMKHRTDRDQREFLQVWHPQGLVFQLSEATLQYLVENQHLCIFAQHLGAIRPLLSFDPLTVAAFRRLKRYQDEQLILVARTSRLVHYNRVRDYLKYTVSDSQGTLVIDIEAVDDPVRGRWLPALEDLRGITFKLSGTGDRRLQIGGKPIAVDELVTGVDEEARVIGIRWFNPEITDHAAFFLSRDRTDFALWSPAKRNALAAETTRIIEFLESERSQVPAEITAENYRAAVDYAIGRYRVGLSHYVEAVEKIGFTSMRTGLDVGSGAGHWCRAFLEHGGQAVGVDPRPEYVEVAGRIAGNFGYADRVRYIAQRGEDMDFEPEMFDCGWSHSVLMFTDVERVFARVARVLNPYAPFYCGYTTLGARLRSIHTALDGGNDGKLANQIAMVVAARLYRCGIYHTPRSRVRCLSLEDLLRVSRVFGFFYAGQPNIEDGSSDDYLGFPATFDFVVRRIKQNERSPRDRLLDGHGMDTAWLNGLAEISSSGCPGLVADALRHVDPELEDASIRDLYAISLIRAGRGGNEATRGLFEGPGANTWLPDSTLGLYWQDRGKISKALSCYEKVPDDHPDKLFLVGMCLLQGKQWDAARNCFSRAIAAGTGDIGEWIGRVASHHGAGDIDGARESFRAFVEWKAADARIPEGLTGSRPGAAAGI